LKFLDSEARGDVLLAIPVVRLHADDDGALDRGVISVVRQ
jgi:hypothetical protein